jgi:hypothetical protein
MKNGILEALARLAAILSPCLSLAANRSPVGIESNDVNKRILQIDANFEFAPLKAYYDMRYAQDPKKALPISSPSIDNASSQTVHVDSGKAPFFPSSIGSLEYQIPATPNFFRTLSSIKSTIEPVNGLKNVS